ncbi:hypothetical protein GUITHDRAFT_141792 [Guillardia theta CCMP2712]|uniref:Uncharacterized protein n=1 Tax=Guillardia theta (strain CCMP2712) TaxID=905079 RepID=L1J0J7_GUITC|nr:hypothetical protein GUITHDRAFT_141792 [Guillardia theta CCMP2712]EKX41812.1 hypothetical protein GUITHDRAFT_141792 [Guillardia theta CCMP2712]|eukprot:XP_005828792.1 hypothetical protein GUITHDRAFT_141792 [Guillardia theta CCMP2712]
MANDDGALSFLMQPGVDVLHEGAGLWEGSAVDENASPCLSALFPELAHSWASSDNVLDSKSPVQLQPAPSVLSFHHSIETAQQPQMCVHPIQQRSIFNSDLGQLQQQQTIKRPREDKEPESSSSSKRSRSEKHYKEIRLLCEAASKYVGGSKFVEKSIQLYDKYRESGKAAGRPSRPMYAAVVLAMSCDDGDEGDEAECKSRLAHIESAAVQVWGKEAPDRRKIWDGFLALQRIVPIRQVEAGPQHLASSVLSKLFRRIQFSTSPAQDQLTRNLLFELATSLEQGPLAGKAPKTIAACTMHLYCRHVGAGLAIAKNIATSLQVVVRRRRSVLEGAGAGGREGQGKRRRGRVGESTVRTNLRGIHTGEGGGEGSLFLKAQTILDQCPPPLNFQVNLNGTMLHANTLAPLGGERKEATIGVKEELVYGGGRLEGPVISMMKPLP